MRLIDADKLESVDFSECMDSFEIMGIIDAQPTINEWIKVEYHYISDEERKKYNISEDIAYMFDCRLPDDDEEEILIVRRINGKYCTEHDICLIDDVYCLDSGTDWIDVVAWMPMPTYCE